MSVGSVGSISGGYRPGVVRSVRAQRFRNSGQPVLSAAVMSPAAPVLDHDVARWLPAWAEARPDALAWADDHRRCDFASASDRVASYGVAQPDPRS